MNIEEYLRLKEPAGWKMRLKSRPNDSWIPKPEWMPINHPYWSEYDFRPVYDSSALSDFQSFNNEELRAAAQAVFDILSKYVKLEPSSEPDSPWMIVGRLGEALAKLSRSSREIRSKDGINS